MVTGYCVVFLLLLLFFIIVLLLFVVISYSRSFDVSSYDTNLTDLGLFIIYIPERSFSLTFLLSIASNGC